MNQCSCYNTSTSCTAHRTMTTGNEQFICFFQFHFISVQSFRDTVTPVTTMTITEELLQRSREQRLCKANMTIFTNEQLQIYTFTLNEINMSLSRAKMSFHCNGREIVAGKVCRVVLLSGSCHAQRRCWWHWSEDAHLSSSEGAAYAVGDRGTINGTRSHFEQPRQCTMSQSLLTRAHLISCRAAVATKAICTCKQHDTQLASTSEAVSATPFLKCHQLS